MHHHRRPQPHFVTLVWLLALLVVPSLAIAEIHITLTNAFIEKYMDRVTIDATYTVDRAHKKPNPPSQDGDLHVAGRAPEIGLASVAEIMNAASVPTAVSAAQQAEGGSAIPVSGVWRIWTEHGGDQEHIQGQPLNAADTTNPDHVFQIHPITMIGGEAVVSTLVPINGYTAKDAHDAFVRYENMRSTITVSNTKRTTTIATTMAGYNYVRFVLELLDSPGTQHVVPDGRLVYAAVRDLDGELLVRKVRMVFVKESAPEQTVRDLPKGARVEILGIPRIDLALVSWRAKNAKTRPEVLRWRLPYEIIVVGVYRVLENE